MSHARVTVLVFVLLTAFLSFPVHADISKLRFEMEEAAKNKSLYVENGYIIKFRDPTAFNKGKNAEKPLIDPFDESKRGKLSVSFGEHSTGQSKENLAAEMGLKGEVLSILETINACACEDG